METGFLLVVIRDCHSLMILVLVFIRFKDHCLSELFYVVGTMLTCHLVYIAVIFQLMLSMIMMTSQ